MRSIRIFAKNMGDPYYEPTIMVHDTLVCSDNTLHKDLHAYCYSDCFHHNSNSDVTLGSKVHTKVF